MKGRRDSEKTKERGGEEGGREERGRKERGREGREREGREEGRQLCVILNSIFFSISSILPRFTFIYQ